MLQSNKRQRSLKKEAKLPFFNSSEKEEDMLEMTDTRVSTNLSEEAKRAMYLVKTEMTSTSYIYDAEFCDL